jgi:NIMA-interacting peptidyl-prolyl cis-trans isomerase 1
MRVQPFAFLFVAVAPVLACGGGVPAKSVEAAAAPSASATASAPLPTEATSVATTTAAPSNAPSAPAPASSATPAATPPSDPSGGASSAGAASTTAAANKPKKITARHILIQWMGCQSAAASVVRTRDQARAVAQEVLRRVKSGEDFPRLVVEFSDEPNAGARGGSLGRFGHGAMVKEFEDAAFALKPGEVSDIVESPFGFHVIQRTE